MATQQEAEAAIAAAEAARASAISTKNDAVGKQTEAQSKQNQIDRPKMDQACSAKYTAAVIEKLTGLGFLAGGDGALGMGDSKLRTARDCLAVGDYEHAVYYATGLNQACWCFGEADGEYDSAYSSFESAISKYDQILACDCQN